MQYFIVSDIHSYYTPLIKALNRAKYNKDNPNHTLVIAGDLFDRGDESKELYEFVKSLPEDRFIYIKGNHEELLELLLEKDIPKYHDYSNGTVKTLCDLTNSDIKKLDVNYWVTSIICETGKYGIDTRRKAYEKVKKYFASVVKKFKELKIMEWINSKCVDFFEIGDYIITHAMIPCKINKCGFIGDEFHVDLVENKEWRTKSSDLDWSSMRWVDPLDYIKSGYFDLEKKNNKTLVFGHWFSIYVKAKEERIDMELKPNYLKTKKNHKMYYGDHYIAIDSCVMKSGFIEVLKINEKGE